MKYIKWIVIAFWYILYTDLAVVYYERIIIPTVAHPILLAQAILGSLLLTLFFGLCARICRNAFYAALRMTTNSVRRAAIR